MSLVLLRVPILQRISCAHRIVANLNETEKDFVLLSGKWNLIHLHMSSFLMFMFLETIGRIEDCFSHFVPSENGRKYRNVQLLPPTSEKWL